LLECAQRFDQRVIRVHRRRERRLLVCKIARATEVFEIVHAAPAAMHVLHFDRFARIDHAPAD
jgi:hypothetical protein